jgi:hypothetical protein
MNAHLALWWWIQLHRRRPRHLLRRPTSTSHVRALNSRVWPRSLTFMSFMTSARH